MGLLLYSNKNIMKTMYYHGVTSDGRRFTLAGELLADEADLNLGIAICGTKENFIKKVGRIKAEGRLKSHNYGGRQLRSLYGWEFGIFAKDGSTLSPDYFVGKEIAIIMYIGAELSKLSSRDLKKQFNLYHNDR
jgi:hypothetical protein